ncbi:MAG TPA: peptidyl-prolyl cis-trans isomerase, partial [Candidatus Eisenbacteria bacterium]|nr:peptidyl-prolyl cis-trans isomerase [Candidatus Eisenbacteria bacterium]
SGGDVAVVGGLHVTRAEFDQRVKAAEQDYRQRMGTALPPALGPVLRRQVLESLIRRDLLILEAKRRGMQASVEEAEAEVKKDPFFHPNGVFDQARFDAIRQQQPAAYASAIEQMRVNLAARKLSEQLAAQHGPEDAALKSQVARRLRRASVDALVLRRGEFSAGFEEPRESDVLAAWRAHPQDYRLPERLTLSVIALSPSGSSAAEAAAVDARADSALAALRKGATTFDALGERLGGVHSGIEFSRESQPPWWQGDPRSTDALYALKPGGVLSSALPSRQGLLLVRVDQHRPAEVAPFRDVARQIRAQLRAQARSASEDRKMRALYASLRDSLKGTAVHVRWAVVDTATLDPGAPTEAQVDGFYRAHLADYSFFDSRAGKVAERPLAEVRDDVVARWRHERRLDMARASADGLRQAWSQGRRDPALERAARVRELGPLLPGAPIDSTVAGRVLADTVAVRGARLGTGVIRAGTGVVVYQTWGPTPGFQPPYEQVRRRLALRLAEREAGEAEAGARALYHAHPESFALGRTLHYSRIVVPPPDILTVPLSRAEVERWHRDHLDQYSAPEVVTASHILFAPADNTPAADARARARADSVLKRLDAGEDFATLARQVTDDEATRDAGGDLGSFGRGAMLPAFENAAFALKVGETSRVVKSEVGYHIIHVRDHLPPMIPPLAQVYANVSSDAARAKADTIAHQRADSLLRVLHTPAQARAFARRNGFMAAPYTRTIGEPTAQREMQGYLFGLDQLKPGQFYPGTVELKGQGWMVSWADSVSAPVAPSWDQARPAALQRWNASAADRALDAKLAELDSLVRAGWSIDSLGAGFGGLTHIGPAGPGMALPGIGGTGALDSLVFGAGGATPLARGKWSGWLRTQSGAARVRVDDRQEPGADQIAAELEKSRRLDVERGLEGTFVDLKKRYPVRILDDKLRQVPLPPLPPS